MIVLICAECGTIFQSFMPCTCPACQSALTYTPSQIFKKIDELNHHIIELENPPQSGVEINTNFIHNKYGYCYYEIEEGKNPIVFNLFVHPEYRRRGHGKWLLDYVINEIRKTGYKGEINIEASPQEESIGLDRLTSFYQGLGLNVINATQEANHGQES
jgi:GNAT superfamily N-acetyltransferase